MRRWLMRIVICLILGVVTTIGVAWGCAWWIDPHGMRVIDFCWEKWEAPDHIGSAHVMLAVFAQRGRQLGVAGYEYENASILHAWDENERVLSNSIVRAADRYGLHNRDSFELGDIPGIGTRLFPWIDQYRNFQWVDRDERVIFDYSAIEATGWPRVAFACEYDLAPNLVTDLWGDNPNVHVWDLVAATGVVVGKVDIIAEQLSLRARHVYLPTEKTLPLRPIFPGFLIDTLIYGAIGFGFFFGFGAMKRALRTRRGRCPNCAYDLRGCAAGSRASPIGCPECGWNRTDDQPPGKAGG